MNLNYHYRLYPCREQEQKFLETLDLCRYVYNLMLDLLIQI
ncbi:MAG: helix-turn-helix domain-containing protein [Candidatus Hydrothermarchaeaceae archaeon]